ncbi:MAG: c-type cytochrome [Panacagrimonas sp.]
MKITRWGAIAALTAASAVLSLPAGAAGSAEAGIEKANTCMGCHGIPGYNNAYPSYRVPKLGGQTPQFLEAALKAYRSGERPHATMHAQAASMSDQDIADVAAYLATAPHK